MDRTRSEYRRSGLGDLRGEAGPAAGTWAIRQVMPGDREAAAGLLLAAYRGTIDDEGEDEADALTAIDEYEQRMLREHSFVVEAGGALVAMSFVVIVDGLHYIDPVATAASSKGLGVGAAVVRTSLVSLAGAGVDDVGAVITDGNTPSERLFARHGFVRVGQWA